MSEVYGSNWVLVFVYYEVHYNGFYRRSQLGKVVVGM